MNLATMPFADLAERLRLMTQRNQYSTRYADIPETFRGMHVEGVVRRVSVEPEPHDRAYYARLQRLWDAQADVYDRYRTHGDKARYTAEMDALDAAFEEQQA